MVKTLILHSKALKAVLSNAMLALMLGNLSETHQTNLKLRLICTSMDLFLDAEVFAYAFMQPPFTHKTYFSLFAHHTVCQHNLIYK